jgi:Gpi18-like mannosyltransferase
MTDTTESGRRSLALSDAETPPPVGRTALSDRLPRAWMFPLLAFAAAWVLILTTWNVANTIYGPMSWERYFWYEDSGFYGALARLGYSSASPTVPHSHPDRAAFFPLYPAVIRLAMYLTGNVIVAGLIVQILVGAASAVAVWSLASHVYGHRVADRAVLLYCAFPGAFVLGVMYSEPLAILLATGCLLAVLNRKWLLAGLLALLAGATHSTMIVLTPLLGVVAVHAIWTRRDWRSLLAPALAPLGTLAFFAYVAPMFHDYLFWFHLERVHWKAHIDFGAHELSVLTWIFPPAHKYPLLYGLLVAMFWIAVIGIGLLIAARAPWPVTLYTALVLVSFCISNADIRPRYGLTMVGIFLGYGAKLPTWMFWPALVVSASVMAFLVGYYPTHLHDLHLPP